MICVREKERGCERGMHSWGKGTNIGKRDEEKTGEKKKGIARQGRIICDGEREKEESAGKSDSEAEREGRTWKKRTEAGRRKERPTCIREGRNMNGGEKIAR